MSINQLKRRNFVKKSSTLLAALATSTAPNVVALDKNKQPNVIFIICDQMRGDAMSCLGHPNINTPHLDKLAREGVLFENAFCNNPVCVPSRLSLFSGKYPHQTGRLSNMPWSGDLLNFEDTISHHFAERGYRLGWAGKNHTYENSAWDNFEQVDLRAREKFRAYSRHVPPHWHSDTLLPAEYCNPKKNTDDAIRFIEKQNNNQPFFLHVSYFDPHPPYMAPAEYTSRYDSSQMKLPEFVPPESLSRRLDDFWRGFRLDQVGDAGLTETLRYYYASIEWGVDYQLGRVMNALNQSGMRENTIVVFTSDHGDFMCDYRLVRKGMFLYNALLHVPLIISAPGRFPQHVRNQELAQLIDIFPTLADMTNGDIPEFCEGISLKPALMGETLNREHIFTSAAYGQVNPDVIHPAIDLSDEDDTPIHTRIMRQSMEPNYKTKMIQTHDWKLILNEDDEPELYALSNGVHEKANIYEQTNASTIHPLMNKLEKWWEW